MSVLPVNRRFVWSSLAWLGAAVYPVVLAATVMKGPGHLVEWEMLVSAALTALVLGLLPRRPLPVLTLLTIAWTGAVSQYQAGTVFALQVAIIDIAAGYVASVRRPRVSVAVAAGTFAVQVASIFAFLGTPYDLLVLTLLLATVVSWTAGNSVRTRRVHAAELRVRETEQAVADERLRIARELHDMVAHSIGIIAIQAGVGGRVIDTQPAEARNALGAIETTSRDTLASLRRMLTGLRKEGALGPAPGLDDLNRLVTATLDAGVRVDVREKGRPRELPSDVDRCAYRIVQEALTNVVRHADVKDCRVTIDYGDDELNIEIEDEGCGGMVGAGFGIVGMRERVGLLRGEFTAGPRPGGGGFRVAARIPA